MSEDNYVDPVNAVVELLVTLGEEAFDELIMRLSPPHAYSSTTAMQIGIESDHIDSDQAEMITGFAVSFVDARLSGAVSPDLPSKVAHRVSQALNLDEAVAERRLGRLMDAPAVRLVARAKQARERRSHITVDLGIETDVRPIFDEEYGEAPALEIVAHALRISSVSDLRGDQQNSKVYEFVLDQHDLAQLAVVVEEALANQRRINRRAERDGTTASFDFKLGELATDGD